MEPITFPMWILREMARRSSLTFFDIESVGLGIEWMNSPREDINISLDKYVLVDDECRPVYAKIVQTDVINCYLLDDEPMKEHVKTLRKLRRKC